MNTSYTRRLVPACAIALAVAALAACNRNEAPMDAPPASTPAPMEPAPAPAAPPTGVPPTSGPATTTPDMGSSTNTTVGEKIDDTVVTTKVKTALLADDTVKGMDIKVTTVAGEVQLAGEVETQAQIDRAVEVAKGVEGAARVQNGMTLKK